MKNRSVKGFTLIELLIVIAIIGILAAVLLPSLLGARSKANDVAAQTVARQVVNAMAGVETKANKIALCAGTAGTAGTATAITVPTADKKIYINTGASDINESSISAAPPVTSVTCGNSSTATAFTVTVLYAGGSTGTVTETVNKQ